MQLIIITLLNQLKGYNSLINFLAQLYCATWCFFFHFWPRREAAREETERQECEALVSVGAV